MALSTTDVLIVGGGPAGLATAIAACRYGLSVIVVDALSLPVDKACGEGIMPDGLDALSQLGDEVHTLGGHPFSGITFCDEKYIAKADFREGSGLGVRRPRLHAFLARKAAELGAQLLWNTPVRNLEGDEISIGERRISARWIVGADGHNSLVRRWMGIQPQTNSARVGLRRHYKIAPWSTHVEVYWAQGIQAYVTPVGEEEICVAIITRRRDIRFDRGLRFFPGLAMRLASAPHSSTDRGALTLCRSLPQVVYGRAALVGEASGAVDAISGQGMMLAFRQALLLAEALSKGDLQIYQRGHALISCRAQLMSRLMLHMSTHTQLRKVVLRCFQSAPALFRLALSFHIDSLPPVLDRDRGHTTPALWKAEGIHK